MRTAFVAALLAMLGVVLPTQTDSSAVKPLFLDVMVGPTQSGPYELLRPERGAKYTAYLTIYDANSRQRYAALALPIPASGRDSARSHTRWFDVTFGVELREGRGQTHVTIEKNGRVWFEQKDVMLISSAKPSLR